MTSPTPDADLPFDLERLGAGLVFATSLPGLEDALTVKAPAGTAVVQAPPGTGKTTLVPPLVANLSGRVIVTQPRRVAARAAARRLAHLDGSRVGDRVGYTVRGEHHAGPDTRVEFVTPGILLRRLLADPGLEGVGAVIIDEVHERALDTDLLLGLLAEVHELRGDLAFLAMSATLDAPRFAALLSTDDGDGPAPVIDCPSALHRLDTRWEPAAVVRLDERGVTRGFLEHVATTAAAAHREALAADPAVDALVFVPGAWEVAQVAGSLRRQVGPAVEVLELHGQIDSASQDRAVRGRAAGDRPRVVVSTSLAESSLTVPGVRLVIDAGLAREPRRDATRGMTGLVTVSASRASAEQRAGRAARQGPGTVVRCYDQKSFGAAPAHPTPEIAVAELTGAALTLACWGAPGGRGLKLPQEPPQATLADAVAVLDELGAIDADGLATDLGRTLSGIPAEPRLARALIDGTAWQRTAAPGGRTGTKQQAAARSVAEIVAMVAGDARAPGADLNRLLAALRSGSEPSSRAWKRETTRLEAILARSRPSKVPAAAAALPPGAGAASEAGLIVALAYPDRIARRVEGAVGESYLLASGTRAGLPAGSSLAGQQWLAVADVSRAAGRAAAGTGAVIRSAAPLDAETAQAAAGQLLTDRVHARFASGKVLARRERRLGSIVLGTTPVRASVEEAAAAVATALESEGLGIIGFSPGADGLRRRMALLHRELGAPWPDVGERALLGRLDEWLGPELQALAAGASVTSIDLSDPLRRLLPWPQASRFADLAPERLQVPSGSKVRIDYPAIDDPEARPVVAVKLQECFGWAATPRLVDDRVPVLFHLLSPRGSPLAVTDDLASFWSGPYAQVRAEMRGKYPKHPWPEDPWSSIATAKTKRRLAQGGLGGPEK
ncbi:ATP-dependent helicase HrpB [Arthrobacter rhombi]|uniref:ATP-dependent helicase HrpB n=1 Tax=Arthrobacter rhombi TaxID=71253 RepID=UPI003FD0A049